MISELMGGLLKANLAAAAAVVVVLVARKIVRARFGARAAYALWAAPILAGIAVVLPHPARHAPLPRVMAPVVAMADVFEADPIVAAAPAAKAGPSAAEIAFSLWLVGALGAAGLLAFHQARFLASLGRVSRQAGRLRRASRAGVGPALVGWVRPWIVTPADFEARFGEGERTLILAHEETHLARGDAAANALSCALQAACWFNPLAHLAARTMRIDQELACDAAVISRFPTARRAYAELLLKTQIAAQPLPLGCHWPAHAAHPLKERIQMLKSPLPGRPMRAAGLVVAASLVGSLGGLAWAAQPSTPGGPGPAERAMAQKDLAARPQVLCKPKPDRTLGPCVTVKEPMWQALPTQADLMGLYPAAARSQGVEGLAHVLCRVDPAGLMHDCAVVGVEAFGAGQRPLAQASKYGFEGPALAATRYYQAKAAPGDGSRMWNFEVAFSPRGEGGLWRPIPITPASQVVAPPPPGNVVAKPVWITKPGPADVARVFPAAAAKAGQEGHVTIGCKFSPTGRLEACKVVTEDPERAGFGAAALALAPIFQAKPVSGDGDQVGGGAVLIPFIFLSPSQAAVPRTEAPASRIDVTYAPDNAPPAPLVLKPRWVYMPTSADLARYYPPDAMKQHFEGTTMLSCVVDVDGRLSGCAARGPSGFGKSADMDEAFRQASLKLVPLFRMEPQLVNGVATGGGRVNIPIRWLLPTDPAAKAALDGLHDPGPAAR